MTKKPINLWSLPIKDQAYYILVGINGSWIYNALFDDMEEDEGFCMRIVEAYREDNCDENGNPTPIVQQHLDESYDAIEAYKALKVVVEKRVDAGNLPLLCDKTMRIIK
jgi:hypothetical protein